MIKLVVNSNIVFSSLIKGKKSRILRKIIFFSSIIELIAPEELLIEIQKHFEKFNSEELEECFHILFTRIGIVPREYYRDKISEAYDIARQFDESDTPFIALSLKLNAPIWTGDKEMIKYGLKSDKYLALDTQAVEELTKGRKLEEVLEDLKKRYLSS
ncbi:Nucleotide-binding protein, PIN domain protein [Ferroglobus placidus DSM 10642]|uniref:Nucleotide-binding protein, PIN domain protein n=1 Tax=Ferroglobus placidus (strain DSM 10642 / AEDII12DO) TaxID=589924 RepID=D3S234_FERPA|nr:PIN domain-containing protein [Ferroglobus placidus]ADC66525.1 Nucleotide-binding protein, PIN domain protein [Ferroglobus placidus DSM 10642]